MTPDAGTISAPRALRLLLVDDSLTMRVFLRAQVLNAYPAARISEAEDGRTALKVLGSEAVDLIVTDLLMPGMDGQSLVQLLRRNPLLRKKPILVVSAALESGADQDWAHEAGIRLLAKPVTPGAIQAAIEALLAR